MHNKFERFQTACTPPDLYRGRRTAECLKNVSGTMGLTLDYFIISGFLNNPENLPYDIKKWIEYDHDYRPSKDV
jgi:hypothetical protein